MLVLPIRNDGAKIINMSNLMKKTGKQKDKGMDIPHSPISKLVLQLSFIHLGDWLVGWLFGSTELSGRLACAVLCCGIVIASNDDWSSVYID